ncbi:hypothetical protein MRX96_012543 [Rhipicephalus microplus]
MLRRATSVRRARQDARLLLRPQLRQPAAADISAGGSHRPRFVPEPERTGWAPGAQLGLASRHARSPRPRTPLHVARGQSLPAFVARRTPKEERQRRNVHDKRIIAADLSPKEAQDLRLRLLPFSEVASIRLLSLRPRSPLRGQCTPWG